MYAVFDDKGQQYKVSEGDTVDVALKDAQPGEEIEFDRVMLYSKEDKVVVGHPTIDNAKVIAEVRGEAAAKKIIVTKFKRRKDAVNRTGHRQKYTRIKIKQIVV